MDRNGCNIFIQVDEGLFLTMRPSFYFRKNVYFKGGIVVHKFAHFLHGFIRGMSRDSGWFTGKFDDGNGIRTNFVIYFSKHTQPKLDLNGNM